MQRYELEGIKRSTEYIIDDIIKSLDVISNYAEDLGLQKSSTTAFTGEIKQKFFDFYSVFITAYEDRKLKIEKEEAENPEV